ncbi:MAG: hypothetical protein ACW7DM_01600, partial [Paraglaciecola chathamensis]
MDKTGALAVALATGAWSLPQKIQEAPMLRLGFNRDSKEDESTLEKQSAPASHVPPAYSSPQQR